MLTYRYRLRPTRRQHRALEAILDGERQLYNAALEERIDAYRKAGVTRTLFDQYRALTDWRKSDPEACTVPAALQRWTLKRVDAAFKSFFKQRSNGRKAGFPRFRGKGRFDTFGFRQICGIRFTKNRISFKGMPGTLRVHLHRQIPEKASIRDCTFTRDSKGWAVGFTINLPEAAPSRGKRVVGIDLGISTFATLSDGGRIPNLHATKLAVRKVRIAHRALSRTTPSSGGRRKARKTLARCHAAIARSRANHLHQASARLVRDYDIIVVEKLEISALARSCLAKHVYDASWAKFISMLHYKAECAGSRVIEVDPRGTSQECSGCGRTVSKRLKDRLHECQGCGLTLDRDLNAARNVLLRAGVSPGLHNVA